MTTQALFHETFLSALAEVVAALHGAKTVGAALRPELGAEAAGKWLSNCLNHEHPQKLDPDQVLFILREGRKAQAHAAINYLLRESGYADAQPIEPEDERAKLQRDFLQGVQHLSQLAARLDRTETPLRKVA